MTRKAKRVPRVKTNSWLFICMDGPDTKPLREKHLFGHLDHIEANNDYYRVAGPMRSDPSGEITGSFFIVDAETEDQAWSKMKGDPYIKSDMYETVTVHSFFPACGNWMGGVTWDQDEIRANMKKYT
jgi:uncharacterized protein YciI